MSAARNRGLWTNRESIAPDSVRGGAESVSWPFRTRSTRAATRRAEPPSREARQRVGVGAPRAHAKKHALGIADKDDLPCAPRCDVEKAALCQQLRQRLAPRQRKPLRAVAFNRVAALRASCAFMLQTLAFVLSPERSTRKRILKPSASVLKFGAFVLEWGVLDRLCGKHYLSYCRFL